MVSEWCGGGGGGTSGGVSAPLDAKALQSGLQRLHALRLELINRHTTTARLSYDDDVDNDRAAVDIERRLGLHMDQVIARTFWYEVSPLFYYPPIPPSPYKYFVFPCIHLFSSNLPLVPSNPRP